jgi:hypothetical protein
MVYWTVVKANLSDGRLDAEFNDWYNRVHVPNFVAMPGFTRAWRVRRLMHSEQRGDPGQEFLAIYETETIDAFLAALHKTELKSGHSWEGWERHLTDWQRSYHRVLGAWRDEAEVQDSVGRYWSIVRVDYLSQLAQAGFAERDFNAWYSDVHVPEVIGNRGFGRAWRLETVPHEEQLGDPRQKYWAVYETERVDDLVVARRDTTAWDGVWAPGIANWSQHYHEVLYEHRHEHRRGESD